VIDDLSFFVFVVVLPELFIGAVLSVVWGCIKGLKKRRGFERATAGF